METSMHISIPQHSNNNNLYKLLLEIRHLERNRWLTEFQIQRNWFPNCFEPKTCFCRSRHSTDVALHKDKTPNYEFNCKMKNVGLSCP